MSLINSIILVDVSMDYVQIKTQFGASCIKILQKKQDYRKYKKQDIKTLNCKFKKFNWQQASELQKQCIRIDTGSFKQVTDWLALTDLKLKKSLVQWDLLDDQGKFVQCNQSNVQMLPPDVLIFLRKKYQKIVGISKQEKQAVIVAFSDILRGTKMLGNWSPKYIKQFFLLNDTGLTLTEIRQMSQSEFQMFVELQGLNIRLNKKNNPTIIGM